MNIFILFKEISTFNCIYKVVGYNAFEHECDMFQTTFWQNLQKKVFEMYKKI